jgi:hypothetical protein
VCGGAGSCLGQVPTYIVELVGAYVGCYGDVEGKVLCGGVRWGRGLEDY